MHIIGLSVLKATFFNNYDSSKTSYNYNELIKTIRECAQHDMLKAINSKVDVASKILDIVPEGLTQGDYQTTLKSLYDPSALLYIYKSYIDKLVKSGRIGLLMTDKGTKLTKKTKENGYKLGLLLVLENKLRQKKSQNFTKRDFIPLFLNYLNLNKEDKFAASLIMTKQFNHSSARLARTTATYKAAENAGPHELDDLEKKEIKDKLFTYIEKIEEFIKSKSGFNYDNLNKDQANIIYSLKREDLDSLID